MGETSKVLWVPDEKFISSSSLWRYVEWLREVRGISFELSIDAGKNVDLYGRLWRWSVEHLEEFWATIHDFYRVSTHTPYRRVLEGTMPGARWFTGARINYAEHVFRAARWGEPAIIYVREDGLRRVVYWDTLARQVASLAAWLRDAGVGRGDVVAGYVSQTPEAAAALLATASLGAIWTQVGAELSPNTAAERLRVLGPKILVATDGYMYRGRGFDRTQDLARVASALGVQRVVTIPNLKPSGEVGVDWGEAAGGRGFELRFEAVEFNEPLWTLFTSGTTGVPKPVVHSHGGIVVEIYKGGLFYNLRPNDIYSGEVFTWYTTPSWAAWNSVVNNLLHGLTIVFYEGDPTANNYTLYWEIVEREGVSMLALSAPYIHGAMKAGLEPGKNYNLRRLKWATSIAAPLLPQGFDWVYQKVKEDVWFSPIYSTTESMSAFSGPCAILPVWRGETQCRWLGAAVNVYDEGGRPVLNEMGEVVVEKPMPSLPVAFWGDPDYTWYRNSYFDLFPNVWRNGDWGILTERGTMVVVGRSDSTIKRKGVRIGSHDIYRVVESLPEVAGSLAIGVEDNLILLVALKPGFQLTDDLRAKINGELRRQLGPYFIADRIIQVPDIPMTRNYKKLEVPLKKIVMGVPLERAVNMSAVANPEALYSCIEALSELKKKP